MEVAHLEKLVAVVVAAILQFGMEQVCTMQSRVVVVDKAIVF